MSNKPSEESGSMLTAAEVAERLNLSEKTIVCLGDHGELPFYTVADGADRRFRLEDVMMFFTRKGHANPE